MAMRRVHRLIPVLIAALLCACGTYSAPRGDRTRASYLFDPMTPADRALEWQRCQQLAPCRAWEDVIGAAPPDIEDAANNGRVNCLDHAREARRLLGRGEIYLFCSARGPHAVLLVDGMVIDTGALTGARVFPEHDLSHYERTCDARNLE
jgi:hypothetical protein